MDPKNKPSANILINGANFPNMAVTNQRRALVACYFIIGRFHITDKSSERTSHLCVKTGRTKF